MMTIRVMRMGMTHRGMDVQVGMRFCSIPRKIVLMPVVLVMGMGMCVFHELMLVFVLMVLSEMKPGTQSHQRPGG